jgi:hypothetical protein
LKKKYPRSLKFFILVKKDIFNKIKGIDETLYSGEDHNFTKRAIKYGKCGILNSRIIVSLRRWEKEGKFKLFLKYLNVEINLIQNKEIRKKVLNYNFGNFK